jgi:hypothetical protein
VRVSSGFLIAVIIAARFLRSPKMEVKRRVKTFRRHNTHADANRAVHRSILSMTWLGFSVPASGSCGRAPRTVFFRLRHATTWSVRSASSILCHWNLCAIGCAPPDPRGCDTEVSHAPQERTPRRRLLSRSPVNDGRVSLPSHGSNAERASLAASKSSQRSSAAMTHARASLGGDFKNCCMLSGEFDGSDRDHFFQRVTGSNNRRERPRRGLSGPRDRLGPAAPVARLTTAARRRQRPGLGASREPAGSPTCDQAPVSRGE